ncbi:MAG: 2TM domain-containing protein [Bacteroidia bacterium]|nr:2TM domain-containing protein [Bacteroidia bacterium]NNF30889.1 2TM domain-containing protein [Flavobacteriaceae bacterium]MBT8275405.1 2TM domain-containing protein [Bacteroidia bacterium]NNJ82094.1 2TM domain-containing protein [Flavobacteriaceae bacterium]NNK54502.1 2TM domain-containing protein [Flavobacteriaceae bacterium]
MEIKTAILKPTDQEKYDNARKKVNAIKGFHSHLTAYIIINIVLLLLQADVISAIADRDIDAHFERWLEWNAWGTAILWGIGLLIHGLYVYRDNFKFLKSWEERKIKEIIEKEEAEERKKYE